MNRVFFVAMTVFSLKWSVFADVEFYLDLVNHSNNRLSVHVKGNNYSDVYVGGSNAAGGTYSVDKGNVLSLTVKTYTINRGDCAHLCDTIEVSSEKDVTQLIVEPSTIDSKFIHISSDVNKLGATMGYHNYAVGYEISFPPRETAKELKVPEEKKRRMTVSRLVSSIVKFFA